MRAHPNGFDVNRPAFLIYADTERDSDNLTKVAHLLVRMGVGLTVRVVRTTDHPDRDGTLGYFCPDPYLLYSSMLRRPHSFRTYRGCTRYANKTCKRLGYDRLYAIITYDAPTETS